MSDHARPTSAPVLAACLLATAGCLPTSRVPPTSSPQGSSFPGQGTVIGVGLELRPIGASVREDGTRREIGYGPRFKLPMLQLISISGRMALGDDCDVGLQLNAGQTGGDVRCGIGGDDRTLALSTGVTHRWWHGWVGRTEVQAGVNHRDGYLAFASSGVTYAAFDHAVPLGGDGTQLEDLLLGPHAPYLRVRQRELAWSSSLVLGLPGPFPSATLFLGVNLDRPILASEASFECIGCDAGRFDDFDPGYRLGGMLGFAATTD